MQNKYVHSPQSQSSNLTVDTLKLRKPRFQRKSSSEKCDCKSASKSRLFCDSISLQKLYVKRLFLKSPGNVPNEKIVESQSRLSTFQSPYKESQINQISSSLVQNKLNSQFLEDSNKFSNLKSESFLFKQNEQEMNIKEKTDKCLKENIFYKQKCQKMELKIKDLISDKEKSKTQLYLLKQDNLRLRIQIEELKKIPSCQTQKDNLELITPRKPRTSFNKNLSKLKQQYVNFREEQDSTKGISDQRFQLFSKRIEQLNALNQKLREDLILQEELYNMKLKMMQQKQDFLEKTLNYTKNTLAQLQKDLGQKQNEILESKRLKELINEKNNQLEKIQSRYNNLLKIVNGEKKRQQNLKSVKNKTQKAFAPIQLKSKHSLETKNAIFDHKQNKQSENMKSKERAGNNSKFDKNSIVIKVMNGSIKTKQNCRIAEYKSTLQLQEKQIQQKKVFKRSNSDLTFSSFNSLELSFEN